MGKLKRNRGKGDKRKGERRKGERESDVVRNKGRRKK